VSPTPAFKKLRKLPRLRVLYLNGTGITDQAIDALAAMQSLKHVYLTSTAVTDFGVAELARKRPDLKVDN
jgi:hypothetical protein